MEPAAPFMGYGKMPSSTAKMKQDIRWASAPKSVVVLEKVHGANVSFTTDGVTARAARRNAFIAESDNFFPLAMPLLERCKGNAIELFEAVQTMVAKEKDKRKVRKLQVFGELFGGFYPGCPTPRGAATAIQASIYYAPHNDFIVFDVAVWFEGRNGGFRFLEWTPPVLALIEAAGFHVSKPLAVCSLEKALDFDINFASTIGQDLFGLPPPELTGRSNLTEGVVVKQVKRSGPGGERIVLKRKNKIFVEKDFKKMVKSNGASDPDADADADADAKAAFDQVHLFLTSCINMPRVECASSKHGDIKDTEIVPQIVDEVVSDVYSELEDEAELRAHLESLAHPEKELMRQKVRIKANEFVLFAHNYFP